MRFLILADGSASIGMGHLTRSLTLARALIDLGGIAEVWGQAVAKAKNLDSSFADVAVREIKPLDEKGNLLPEILRFRPQVTLVDGYHYPKSFFESLSQSGLVYGVLDDNGETLAPSPQIVINQNPDASCRDYGFDVEPRRFLLGLQYCLLRGDLVKSRTTRPSLPLPVFLSLGGSDPLGLTLPLAQELSKTGITLTVAVGPSFTNAEHTKTELQKVERVRLVPPKNMANEMAGAQLCVISAGTTMWEANALQRKVIALVVAENQVRPATAAVRLGIALDSVDFRNPAARHESAAKVAFLCRQSMGAPEPQKIVNLEGSKRVAEAIFSLAASLS